MKLADAKRTLEEINQTERICRAVESFKADSDTIGAKRAAVEELKKGLDDPEAKAISERSNAIKAQLDGIKEEDEFYANGSQLFKERTLVQQHPDTLFAERRESSAQFCGANDRYCENFNEDRA